MDGAFEVIHNSLESEPDVAGLSWLFYVFITFSTTLVIFNLYMAVVVNTFQEVRNKKENLKGNHEEPEQKLQSIGKEASCNLAKVKVLSDRIENEHADMKQNDSSKLVGLSQESHLKTDGEIGGVMNSSDNAGKTKFGAHGSDPAEDEAIYSANVVEMDRPFTAGSCLRALEIPKGGSESGVPESGNENTSMESEHRTMGAGSEERHPDYGDTDQRPERQKPTGLQIQLRNGIGATVEDVYGTDESLGEKDDLSLSETWAATILRASSFKHFISATVILHTLAMAVDTDGETELPQLMIIGVYYGANFVFIIEILLRLLANDDDKAYLFITNPFHVVECFLVCCGIAGLMTGDRVLLLLPSVRVLRLCKYSPTLQDLLEDCVVTQRSFISLMLFICVVGFCFAVVGRYIFRDEVDPISRSNFGNLQQSLLTIFQLFTGDQWRYVGFVLLIPYNSIVN